MSKMIAWIAGLALLGGSGVLLSRDEPTPSAAARSLESIKKLAGDWVRIDEDGKPGEEVANSFRVTAGGSAVLELIFPGTSMEMVTLYHVDGDDLVLTHYCVLGNQPRMKAKRGLPANRLVFECAGGTNMKETDHHMHHAEYTFVDANRIRTVWQAIDKGKVTHTVESELVRKAD